MNIEDNLKILQKVKKQQCKDEKVKMNFHSVFVLIKDLFFLKENAIPLSIFLRQKRDIQGLADLRPNSGMNPTYQAYFEALLAPNQNQNQHPSDRAAVIKYIRRRERRKRA